MKYKVYELNGSLEFAQEIDDVWNEHEAAEQFAEQDVDGNIDGLYNSHDDRQERGEICDHGLIRDLQKDGQPVCVVDEEGKTYHFRVGITEYIPTYQAELIKETK